MKTHHSIVAQARVSFVPTGMIEKEVAYPTIEIEYSYLPGYPATGPSRYSGGEPGAGAELDFVSAKLLDGDGLDPEQKTVEEWARDWLDDDGYDAACQHAEEGRQPDPDDARDAQLERDWDEQIKDWEED